MPGIGDFFRGLFGRRDDPRLEALQEFAATRKGVEGFVEPRTATQPTTLLLVDRDGDHLRAPVREPADATRFCERHGIPVYDAAVIGYPKRMRDFDRARRAAEDEYVDRQFEDLERRFRGEGGTDSGRS
ncbi:MAG TPA: oxidoreductase [Actinomycetota bacterium]|jgi:hypothetical protein|nr:oxidoreductase [Actinomycetota bacterium]